MKRIWSLLKETYGAWRDDYAASMGAAISYYTVFSIAPLLLIVIAIAGLAFGQEAAQGRVVAELGGLLGEEGAAAIQGLLESASKPLRGGLGAVIGVITLLIGATTVFAELQGALDRIWRSPAAAKVEGIWALLRARVLSFGLILAVGFVLLVSLVVSALLSALGGVMGDLLGSMERLLQLLNIIVSFGLITVLFALIYKYLPRVSVAWRDVWIGALFTSLLFVLGKFLIGLYIGKSGVASGFGAAGSVIVLLVWTYYSAQIFLLGAEFTWVYAHRYGSKRGERPRAAPAIPSRSPDDLRAAEASGAAERAPVGADRRR